MKRNKEIGFDYQNVVLFVYLICILCGRDAKQSEVFLHIEIMSANGYFFQLVL